MKKGLLILGLCSLIGSIRVDASTLIRYFQPNVKVVNTPSTENPDLVSFEVSGFLEDQQISISKTVRELLIESKTKSSWSGWSMMRRGNGLYRAHCAKNDSLPNCQKLAEVDNQGNLTLAAGFEAQAQYMEVSRGALEILSGLIFSISMPTADYVSLYFNRVP